MLAVLVRVGSATHARGGKAVRLEGHPGSPASPANCSTAGLRGRTGLPFGLVLPMKPAHIAEDCR